MNTDRLIDELLAGAPPKVVNLSISKLHPFPAHPFKVRDDEDMEQLTQSIQTQGVLSPLVVRPLENGEHEVISGHRRLYACRKAGIEMIPALIYEMDHDAAAIALVDSNLHRERILPSEKAFAYKMKLEALNHQGTSGQLGQKWTRDSMAEGTDDSSRQIHRYIRLTNLSPGILEKVDEGKIALTPAVELSYLTETEQQELLETMESEDCTPSLSQAIALKQSSQNGNLTMDRIFTIMTQPKANQQEKISFKVSEIRDYFPKNYTAAQMSKDILKGLELLKRQRQRNRDAR